MVLEPGHYYVLNDDMLIHVLSVNGNIIDFRSLASVTHNLYSYNFDDSNRSSWVMTLETLKDSTVVEVTKKDFPLYISWSYKSKEFSEILKGAT